MKVGKRQKNGTIAANKISSIKESIAEMPVEMTVAAHV